MTLKDRVLALLPGHKAAATDDEAVDDVQNRDAEDRFGLQMLYDGTNNPAETSPAQADDENISLEPVDIVAVHGLGGGAISTWRHPDSKVIWLRDLLPSSMRKSRVMSYGYDAMIYKNRSTLHMMHNAENLLFEVQAARKSEKLRARRIIFVGHSMGGILIKKALCMAREEDKYHELLHSTCGIMFMGTPHDGADAAKLASTIANIANSITTLNTNHLKTLERDSVPLQDISRSFGFLKDLRIVTVIESNQTRIPYTRVYTLIVPQASARLNLGDRETLFSVVDADHHMVCKFRNGEANQYNKVKTALHNLATLQGASNFVLALQQIPYAPDPNFVGRASILDGLSKTFKARGVHNRIALYGLGGIGKSGITIEFGHRFRQLFPETHIFWVRGASLQRFEQSYRAIAKGLNLDGHDNPQTDILEMVKQWLISSPKRWLMILDNADEERLYFPIQKMTADHVNRSAQILESETRTLSQFLPQNPNGCILITSRDKQTALQLVGNLPKNLIEVEKLDSEDSLAVIRSRLSAEKFINADLRAFATMLGNIPLAITQACVYIEANETMGVNEYCEKFHENGDMQQRLLNKASYDLRRDPDIPNAVITTWRISFEHIRTRNPFAAQVLSFLGVLDRQHIPRYLLGGLKHDQLEVDEAVSQLIAFCLIKTEMNRDFLEIHPLVEAALLAWMSECEKLTHWLRVAIILFDQVFPKDLHGNVGSWSRCNLLVPHALKVIQTSLQLPELHTAALAALYTCVAVSLDTQFRLEEAAMLHQKAVELVTNEWGPHGAVTLNYQCNLAGTLRNQKKLREAEIIYRGIWNYLQGNVSHTKSWEKLWFQVPNSLARVLTDMGKTVEARKMQESLLKVTLVNKGEDDENTLRIMNNLALALFKEDRYDEAEIMGHRALEKQLRVLEPDNQLIMYTMKNLSNYSRARKEFSKAKEYIEAVAIMEEELLPVGHPDRLATSKTLASLFYFQDNHSEAEKILRQAQADGDLFPQKSYVLLNLRAELATVLDAQGKYSEAETIARDVLSSKQTSSDSSDTDTWTVMSILASILHHLHRDHEAEDLHWQLLEHHADNGTPNKDGLTRGASAALGSIIAVLGLDMDAESLSYFDKILERQDAQRQTFQKRVRLLSLVLAKLGRYTEGLELEAKWRDQSDSSSLWKVNNLAEQYLRSDRKLAAKTLLEPLYAEAQERLGPTDNLTLSTAGLLAVAVGSDTDEGDSPQ